MQGTGYVNGLGHVSHPAAIRFDREYLIDRLALAAPDATETQRENVIGAVLAHSDAQQVIRFATSLEQAILDRTKGR